ncbi:MAG: SPOR domain-containing protein [Gammaproteobacteria bacterium]|nr:SPOR domain-containing protein [Gammaproteobacteria bacterium]
MRSRSCVAARVRGFGKLAACVLALLAVPMAGATEAGDPFSMPYASRQAAEQAAAELRAAGIAVRIEEARDDGAALFSVQLRGFERWADAQRVARSLRQQGIESFVFPPPDGRGYAVGAGAFSTMENAERMALRLLSLGHHEVYTLRLGSGAVAWRLIEEQSGGDKPAADASRSFTPSAASASLSRAFARSSFSGGLERMHAESGWMTERDDVDGSAYLRADAYAGWRSAGSWEARIAARLYAWHQHGETEFTHGEIDYGDSWLRYRGEDWRVTAGAQTVIWGRADELPPTDRLSVQDVTRFALDDLSERRRSAPLLRLERFIGDSKFDLLWMPRFRAAELPHDDDIWHPVDRRRGALLGIRPDPLLAALLQGGGFDEDDDGDGGIGLRWSRSGAGMDYAFSVQRARHSLPYYELDAAVRDTLLLNPLDPAAAIAAGDASRTFVARHPHSTVIGADLGFVTGGVTWRLEAAWLSDVPVTTGDLRMDTVSAVDWTAGLEFFPGDAETRVTLQLTGRELFDLPDPILDRERIVALGGELETILSGYRWRGRMRFSLGLDRRDVYLNPELAFIAFEPHEFYLAGHWLDGADMTAGGHFQDNDLIALGWRARY